MMWWILVIYASGAIKILLTIMAVFSFVAVFLAFTVLFSDGDPVLFLFIFALILIGSVFSVASFTMPDSYEAAAWIDYTVELDREHPMYSRIESWLSE